MKDSVCVGVVGAGIISDIYLQNMTGKFDNLRVKTVSASNLAKAQEKARRYGLAACSVEDMIPAVLPERPAVQPPAQVVSASRSPKYCTEGGKKIPEGSKFCPFCGNKIIL